MSFSMQYFAFLLEYEADNGANNKSLYVKDVGDGAITIVGGVVIRDMAYNLGSGAVRDYKTCDLIATGDLLDEETLKMLRKEILETTAAEIDGQKQWLKNLVERRLDVIRIAQGDVDAYTRNYRLGKMEIVEENRSFRLYTVTVEGQPHETSSYIQYTIK